MPQNDDFEIVYQPNRELSGAPLAFTESFIRGYELTVNSGAGFGLASRPERQPDGQSCFFAAAVAVANRYGLIKTEAIKDTVELLTQKGRSLGIVNDHGFNIIARDQIAQFLGSIGLLPEFIFFVPSQTDVQSAWQLGTRVASTLNDGFGIAILRPVQQHFVLLHQHSGPNQNFIFDPLSGTDTPHNTSLIARNIGAISNNQFRPGQNAIVVLKPKQEPDLVIHEVRKS